MTTIAAPMVHDELDGVVSALCVRFPNRAGHDIARVVAAVYAELAANATVTAHLVPLTLNRSRRLLLGGTGGLADEVGVDRSMQDSSQ